MAPADRLAALLLFIARAFALGEPCLLANNVLDPQTHNFHSDCSPKEYCAEAWQVARTASSTGSSLAPVATQVDDDPSISELFRRGPVANTTTTCQPRGCRKDEDPFGYDVEVDVLPPKCADDEFCPDEGSACQDLVPLGGACQLDRDGPSSSYAAHGG